MEIRRIGEALLRFQPTVFLSRPCQQRLNIIYRNIATNPLSSASPRAYSVSAARRQQQPASSSPADYQSSDDASSSNNAPKQNGASPSISDGIGSLLDANLDFTRNDAVRRTSRFASPRAQAANRNTTSYGIPTGSSADDATARFSNSSSLSGSMTRMMTGDKSAAYAASYIGGGLGNLGGPYGYGAAAAPKSLIEPPDPSTLPRLGPMVGRSVQIRQDAGMDLAKGLRQLDVICARNKVRGDSYKQKYHERPGLKRKRLASERWRRRFMEGFKATVSRVQYLKRQGW